MNETPARMGWSWVKQGFGMLRKQPAGLSALLFSYMLLLAVLSFIPLLGQLAQTILMPAFAVGFMSGARAIALDKPVMPGLLFAGFRKPAIGALCRLGVLHLGVAVLMLLAIKLSTDTAMLEKVSPANMEGNAELFYESGLVRGIVLGALIYLPCLLVIELAAALAFWNGMAPMKALFYSFFAIKRAIGAFLVFGASLFVLTMVVLNLVTLLVGGTAFGFGVMTVVILLLYGVGHCALYAAYTHIFGAPADEPAAPPKP